MGSRPKKGPHAIETLIARNQRAWHPRTYEAWFRLNPFQALLRRREQTASLAGVARFALPGHSVLEVGCGTGHYTLPLARACQRVVAVDSSGDMLRFLERRLRKRAVTNVTTHRGSLGLPLDLGEQFDGVVAIGLLNYVPDLAGALRTLTSHLRPGGWAVLSVPLANSNGRLYQLSERLTGRRVWLYSPGAFANAAARHGLRVERATPAGVSRRGLTLVNEATLVPLPERMAA